MEETTVNFGKYKGKPVDLLLQDEQYVSWLLNNHVMDKYKGTKLYQIIVNNFNPTTIQDTPEHNALQVKFLDNEFLKKYIIAMCTKDKEENLKILRSNIINIFSETALREVGPLIKEFFSVDGNTISVNIFTFMEKQLNTAFEDLFNVKFEENGIDVKIYDAIHFNKTTYLTFSQKSSSFKEYTYDIIGLSLKNLFSYTYFLELKPMLGDDYPGVFRKILSYRNRRIDNTYIDLVVDDFTSSAVTKDQFRKMCKNNDIGLIFVDEIENTIIPTIDIMVTDEVLQYLNVGNFNHTSNCLSPITTINPEGYK